MSQGSPHITPHWVSKEPPTPPWTSAREACMREKLITAEIEQSFPCRQSPKTSFSCNFLGLAGHIETEDKTDPIPPPLPFTSALLRTVKGFSHPPPCEHPFVAGLQSLTNSSSLLPSGISVYCLHPPPHTHTPGTQLSL